MIKGIAIGCLMLAAMACNNEKQAPETTTMEQQEQPNTLTKQEQEEGWELLFDGASLKGWHGYGNKPMGKAWKAADGTLMFDAAAKKEKTDGGDIVSDEEYENFELKFDWKIEEGGNSGVLFNTIENPDKFEYPYQSGPEMQVLDNERHPDAKIIKHRAGDLYDLISSSKETVKPALQWNTASIKVLNGKLDMYLNGANVVSTMMWDDNWKALIAASKFRDMEGWGMYKKGKLSLQDHGNTVWFRNIKIRKL